MLSEIDLSVSKHQIVSIVGPNGVGKSTLLTVLRKHLASGVTTDVAAQAGSITPVGRSALRIGWSLQDPELHLGKTAIENILGPKFVTSRHEDRWLAAKSSVGLLLKEIGLDDFRSRKLAELSKGRRQLVSVARAIYYGRDLVLLDEPTAGLDDKVIPLFSRMLNRRVSDGTSVIVVTHDHEWSENMSSRQLYLFNGTLKPLNPSHERSF